MQYVNIIGTYIGNINMLDSPSKYFFFQSRKQIR